MVYDARSTGALRMAEHYGIGPKKIEDDAILLGRLSRAHAQDAGKYDPRIPANIMEDAAANFFWEQVVSDFCLHGTAGEPEKRLLALQPDAETIAVLADAEAPASDEPNKMTVGASVWIDLTRARVSLDGHPDFVVAGLFGAGKLSLPPYTDISPPKIGMIYLNPMTSDVDPEWVVVWTKGNPEKIVGRRPDFIDQIDITETARRLDSFYDLILLYRTTIDPENLGSTVELVGAHRTGKERRNPIRSRRSFFRVQTLKAPQDRFGRSGSGSGWTLNVRVKVRGHFRLQPHGPQSSLRKLIWVDAFERGPKDARVKPTLDRL